jgi:V8-like Glu-specific endopeptidase
MAQWRVGVVGVAALVGIAGAAEVAWAEGGGQGGARGTTVPWAERSGPVAHEGTRDEWRVVHSTVVEVPGARWVRLSLRGTRLSGDPSADGARLLITSLKDGAVQVLSGESLAQWNQTSAYFNGDAVQVDVLAIGSRGEGDASELSIDAVTYGEVASPFQTRDACFGADQRVLHTDPRIARLTGAQCSTFTINDTNGMFLSAGHCGMSPAFVMEFNVPLSDNGGNIQHPAPQFQFSPEMPSLQAEPDRVLGEDWQYFAVFPNSTTGLTPKQQQGSVFTLAASAPAVAVGLTARMSGYGTSFSPPTLNEVLKTDNGDYVESVGTIIGYQADSSGGNSGSPVELEQTGLVIGIHTTGFCSAIGRNQGTAIQRVPLQTALANPTGIKRTGKFAPLGKVIAAGDLANNMGQCDATTGQFGRFGTFSNRTQGATFDPTIGAERLLVIGAGSNTLGQVDWPSKAYSVLGPVTGVALTITGLGFDPITSTLYAVTGADGQLYSVSLATLAATPIGVPAGLNLGALEFDYATRKLFAIDDDAVLGSRLVQVHPTTGVATVVGVLGAGIDDCNGLAISNDDGKLYAINATNDSLYELNKTTGAATLVGDTLGSFGSLFGMTAESQMPCDPIDFNGDGIFPDNQDVTDLLAAFAGAPCGTCGDLDFNNDGVFPDSEDLATFLRVFAGGPCRLGS